uniref:Ribosomal protein S3 n=1 Tax=Percursaria percursa TaxID=153906 RepID=A0A8K1JAS5_9CHLO|nr:ribosomal protein S3 [Percursaria percursa]
MYKHCQSLRKKTKFIKYSLSKVYDLNSISVFSKRKPQITPYILASGFSFDLSNLQTIYLEKKIIQAAFKEQFSRESSDFYRLQTLQFVLHCLKIGFVDNCIQFSKDLFFDKSSNKLPMSSLAFLRTAKPVYFFEKKKQYILGKKLSKITPLTTIKEEASYKTAQSKKQITFTQIKWDLFSGSGLMCANWILDKLIFELNCSDKRRVGPVLNQFINDIRLLIRSMGSICPILGIQIRITGRLGSQKKAMAQQISKCVGKVPLSTLRQNVDYSQGFVSTRFGVIGIKVWVCYRQS